MILLSSSCSFPVFIYTLCWVPLWNGPPSSNRRFRRDPDTEVSSKKPKDADRSVVSAPGHGVLLNAPAEVPFCMRNFSRTKWPFMFQRMSQSNIWEIALCKLNLTRSYGAGILIKIWPCTTYNCLPWIILPLWRSIAWLRFGLIFYLKTWPNILDFL